MPAPTETESATSNLYAAPRVVTDAGECLFYHTMDLPGLGTFEGYWDIRGREEEYLGGADFAGRRVLEVGPASGALTFHMERRGAEVVSVEAAEDYAWEFGWDFPGEIVGEAEQRLRSHREMMRALRNSYWFSHRAFASKARVHYGSAYSIPAGLGRFDVAVMACILLHNKSPLRILENCARAAGEAIVIVEPFRELQLAQSHAEFLPRAGDRAWDTWWGFSPGYFTGVLRSMGFPHSRVTFHRQTCFGKPADLFTVVARREPPAAESSSPARPSAALNCPVERLRLAAGSLVRLPVSVVNTGDAPLTSDGGVPPIFLSYHWRDANGAEAVWDGLRTPLPRTLVRGDREELLLTARAPEGPGEYTLELTLVAEGVAWLEETQRGLPLRVAATVEPAATVRPPEPRL